MQANVFTAIWIVDTPPPLDVRIPPHATAMPAYILPLPEQLQRQHHDRSPWVRLRGQATEAEKKRRGATDDDLNYYSLQNAPLIAVRRFAAVADFLVRHSSLLKATRTSSKPLEPPPTSNVAIRLVGPCTHTLPAATSQAVTAVDARLMVAVELAPESISLYSEAAMAALRVREMFLVRLIPPSM